MNRKRIIKYVILIALAAACIAGIIIWFNSRGNADNADERGFEPIKANEIKEMVALSTISIDREVPVRGSVGTRHLVGIMRITGDISYDLERLEIREQGDTIIVLLPPETITLRESTLPNSYRVIDQWNDKFLGSTKMSADEENAIKKRALKAAENDIRAKGYTKRARKAAIENLRTLLGATTGRPLFIDTIPPMGAQQNIRPDVRVMVIDAPSSEKGGNVPDKKEDKDL